MDSKSKNIETLMGNEADDIINELLNISGRIRKKKKMGKSEFAFESVDLSYYSLHKTRPTNKE